MYFYPSRKPLKILYSESDVRNMVEWEVPSLHPQFPPYKWCSLPGQSGEMTLDPVGGCEAQDQENHFEKAGPAMVAGLLNVVLATDQK